MPRSDRVGDERCETRMRGKKMRLLLTSIAKQNVVFSPGYVFRRLGVRMEAVSSGGSAPAAVPGMIPSSSSEGASVLNARAGFIPVDPSTPAGRHLYLAQMLLLPILPMVAFLVQNAYELMDTAEEHARTQELYGQVSPLPG